MKNYSTVYTALLLLIFFIVGLYGTITTQAPMEDALVGPLWLPYISLSGGAICILLLVLRCFFEKNEVKVQKNITPIIKTFCYIGFFCLYLAGMVYIGDYALANEINLLPYGLGFCVATLIFLSTSMYALGRRNYIQILIITLSVVTALLILFGHFFNIILP